MVRLQNTITTLAVLLLLTACGPSEEFIAQRQGQNQDPAQLEQQEAELTELRQALQQATDNNKDLQAKLTGATEQNRLLSAEQQRLAEAEKELTAAETDSARLQDENKTLVQQIAQLNNASQNDQQPNQQNLGELQTQLQAVQSPIAANATHGQWLEQR